MGSEAARSIRLEIYPRLMFDNAHAHHLFRRSSFDFRHRILCRSCHWHLGRSAETITRTMPSTCLLMEPSTTMSLPPPRTVIHPSGSDCQKAGGARRATSRRSTKGRQAGCRRTITWPSTSRAGPGGSSLTGYWVGRIGRPRQTRPRGETRDPVPGTVPHVGQRPRCLTSSAPQAKPKD